MAGATWSCSSGAWTDRRRAGPTGLGLKRGRRASDLQIGLGVVVALAGVYLHVDGPNAHTAGLVVLAGVIAFGFFELTQGRYTPGVIVAGFALYRMVAGGPAAQQPVAQQPGPQGWQAQYGQPAQPTWNPQFGPPPPAPVPPVQQYGPPSAVPAPVAPPDPYAAPPA